MRAWIFILLLFSIQVFAEPLRLEAQVGQCEYGKTAIGGWWNDAYPTNIDLKSSCWQLGASRIERNYWWGNLGWRVAYVDLGRYKADNQFAVRDDQQFTSFDPSECDRKTLKNCVGRGKMNGRARGVTFTAITEQKWDPMTFGLEAGAFIYYNRFDVAVYPIYEGDFGVTPNAWGDWWITPVIGLTANYKYLFATLRTYLDVKAHERGCQGCSGITEGPAWQATLGVQVSF